MARIVEITATPTEANVRFDDDVTVWLERPLTLRKCQEAWYNATHPTGPTTDTVTVGDEIPSTRP